MSLADLRREYSHASLDERDVDPDPMVQFGRWFDEARRAELLEPNAMVLATATPDGAPSARVVLLKGADERGFCFYTDYRSRKARELAANPRAALLFYWGELERQVRITGTVDRLPREESERYFRTRPRGSQLGAWASHQSEVIGSRQELIERLEEIRARFPDDVPLPPHWGGFVLRPETIEFWQGRESRLHDRVLYTRRPDGGWTIQRLAP